MCVCVCDVSPLEEIDRQLLEENKVERERIGEEIKELRERNVSLIGYSMFFTYSLHCYCQINCIF